MKDLCRNKLLNKLHATYAIGLILPRIDFIIALCANIEHNPVAHRRKFVRQEPGPAALLSREEGI